jgi:eukaryotic-like serine/threonine-protein kinase
MGSSPIHRRPRPAVPPGAPTLQYGDSIGPYIINGFAGTGATSFVYRARRKDGFDPVAIKVLHPHLVADATKRLKFYREARIMMRMQHPNVVRFEEIIEDGDTLAFVMEYVDGVTLDDWRGRHGGPIDEMTLACVFVDILRGLSHAHRRGVVHRDLKPANILITPLDGRYVAKLIDFGVARFVDEDLCPEERKKIVGTAAYISPEEVRDPESVCQASDLYSIGVMLYEACCGRRPFDEMAVRELLDAHAHVDPERPRELNPKLSRGMESVIMRTLHKSPDARFDSAPEMIRALELALEGAMEMEAEQWQEALADEQMTTEWHRVVEKVARRRQSSVVGFVRRCLETAFVLLTATGTTGSVSDPHHLNRRHDIHLPLG